MAELVNMLTEDTIFLDVEGGSFSEVMDTLVIELVSPSFCLLTLEQTSVNSAVRFREELLLSAS